MPVALVIWLDVDFGASKTGLTTVGYRQYNATGGDVVARTEVGVTEIGNGVYGADVPIDSAAVGIQWDTGEATPIFASKNVADILQNQAIADTLVDIEAALAADAVLIQTIIDFLEGDRVESRVKTQIFKKGTAIEILNKDVGGSLLPHNVVITTTEP